MADPDPANFSTKADQGGPIVVTNATVVGYNHQVEYFGSDIGFKKTIGLDLNCTLVATAAFSEGNIAPGVDDFLKLLNSSQDYSTLTINGVEQEGTAKVLSFSVAEGDMADGATCSISFLIHSTYGNLLDKLTNKLPDGGPSYLDYKAGADAEFGQILDSFTDSISLSRSDNSTSYTRNIAISANKSRNIANLGEKIGLFVKAVLGYGTFSFPDVGADYEPDIQLLADPDNGFKKFITETSDELSNTYTFQESLQSSNVVGDYSSVITHTYTREPGGVETVTENGALIGLLESSRIDAAEVGYTTELAAASDRMRGFYTKARMCDAKTGGSCTTALSADLNECADGSLLFLTKGKSTNTFEGTISYSFVSNNDPKYKDGGDAGECGAKWEYSLTLDSDGVYETATEQGTINGEGYIKYAPQIRGNPAEFTKYPKYKSAKAFFEAHVLKTGGDDLNDRITAIIDASNFDVSPKPTRRTQSHAPRQGVISYSRSFSNNPIYQLNGSTKLIKKIESSNTINATVPIVHNFISLSKSNNKDLNRHIVQEQSTESLSTVANSITAIGYRIPITKERTEIERIGNIAKGQIKFISDDEDMMDGDTIWMSSATFSFASLNDVTFTLNTSFNKGVGAC